MSERSRFKGKGVTKINFEDGFPHANDFSIRVQYLDLIKKGMELGEFY